MKSFNDIQYKDETYDHVMHAYVQKHKKVKDEKVLFLSGKHFYFYDKDELKGIKTLVHLKKLNEIKYLDDTIKDFNNLLKKNTYVYGKFIASKPMLSLKTHILYGKLIDVIFNLLDNKIDRSLTPRIVTALFSAYQFKILDMTEIDGVTYFHAKKI